MHAYLYLYTPHSAIYTVHGYSPCQFIFAVVADQFCFIFLFFYFVYVPFVFLYTVLLWYFEAQLVAMWIWVYLQLCVWIVRHTKHNLHIHMQLRKARATAAVPTFSRRQCHQANVHTYKSLIDCIIVLFRGNIGIAWKQINFFAARDSRIVSFKLHSTSIRLVRHEHNIYVYSKSIWHTRICAAQTLQTLSIESKSNLLLCVRLVRIQLDVARVCL